MRRDFLQFPQNQHEIICTNTPHKEGNHSRDYTDRRAGHRTDCVGSM